MLDRRTLLKFFPLAALLERIVASLRAKKATRHPTADDVQWWIGYLDSREIALKRWTNLDADGHVIPLSGGWHVIKGTRYLKSIGVRDLLPLARIEQLQTFVLNQYGADDAAAIYHLLLDRLWDETWWISNQVDKAAIWRAERRTESSEEAERRFNLPPGSLRRSAATQRQAHTPR